MVLIRTNLQLPVNVFQQCDSALFLNVFTVHCNQKVQVQYACTWNELEALSFKHMITC